MCDQKRQRSLREFSTHTAALRELCDWLLEVGCEQIAMESTGVYWKPLYNLFEMTDLSAIIVNAQHMKALSGRKIDVKDTEWIADLLRHGLLKPGRRGQTRRREDKPGQQDAEVNTGQLLEIGFANEYVYCEESIPSTT